MGRREVLKELFVPNYKVFNILSPSSLSNKAEENLMWAKNHRIILDQTSAKSCSIPSALFTQRSDDRTSRMSKVLSPNCFVGGRMRMTAAQQSDMFCASKKLTRFLLGTFKNICIIWRDEKTAKYDRKIRYTYNWQSYVLSIGSKPHLSKWEVSVQPIIHQQQNLIARQSKFNSNQSQQVASKSSLPTN